MEHPLTSKEREILIELVRLAGGVGRMITATQLRDANFADFVFKVCKRNVAYPDAQQSRVLQKLRDKNYIEMNDGKYTVITPP